jgi:hypothetical protein
METGKVHREPFDDQVKYYEVEATDTEILEIETLFTELNETEYSGAPLAKPWNDKIGREHRDLQQSLLDRIFTSIYELGTEKTKEEIRTMNGLDQRV